ncbi:MAG: hypothetical protein A2504_02235 [Bdellovibrionales bacterium RIFOXYD12_FULL_39_22]|nr:MAG: hypothetical protein A2385_12260 [Bdellovibrionales bacterium RIFOXYB1_FULL_39_21]OFZ41414.1 MAG: hypothetical protein A2485_01430 [Bdellovibrionales bacterium RIFOXYC12_FULL_39_17]OFZ45369.1 MAG: hypothetical protein A2404_13445 [Bdellovibrionales bacterium RIFOXYC1_FULL_39_130]OFZ74565.1 MAG: hypothetical protein A2560_12550 [Bdellovibrionales bacterium RIFOXYD1_FULL_39_84]OFZ74857.1 MAG: hypothetical protein A2451_04595 [Bdellovibrionales bacterium RIFOXYC2_FULL_39_8]OFZ92574.1 MAG:
MMRHFGRFLFFSVFLMGVTFARNESTRFYIEQNRKAENIFQYNSYENIISGGAAFLIGNIGYVLSDSGFLKLSYAAIQTIGIINIGQGIYKLKSPNVDASFYRMLTDNRIKYYSKEAIADRLLEILAKEERAKRLSLLYSSAFLATQYFLNATVYASEDKVENIYMFLGGINVIIAIYMGLYKDDSEKFYFGDDYDISPFAYQEDKNNFSTGAILTFRF